MNDVFVQEAAPERAIMGWAAEPDDPRVLQPTITDDQVKLWKQTRTAVREVAERERRSMADVHRSSGVAQATLSAWYAGRYRGSYANVTAEMRRWLAATVEARHAALPQLVEPGFVETKIAKRVLEELLYAQEMPGVVVITLGPGMGKTTAIREARRLRPNTFVVTLSPSVQTVPAVMREVAIAVGIPSHPRELRTRIGEKIRRNGRKTLLMIDEAQNLSDDAVQELRHLFDIYEVGLALLGNEDVYTRWGATKPRDGYGQTHRRIDGRLRKLKPTTQDVELFVDAWGIADLEINALLRQIGMKPGAFGQISKTLKRAALRASGAGRSMTADDVRKAWFNRSGEDVL